MELIKWSRSDIRAGDKVEFDFFLAPFAGAPDSAGTALQREITGQTLQ
jgi:hypothetical protein